MSQAADKHNEAQRVLDEHAANTSGANERLQGNIEASHAQAQRNLDDMEAKARAQQDALNSSLRERHDYAQERLDNAGSNVNFYEREKTKRVAPSGMKENRTLDDIRNEQISRYNRFNDIAIGASQQYEKNFGETSFGTPVQRSQQGYQPRTTAFQTTTVTSTEVRQEAHIAGAHQNTANATNKQGLTETASLDALREEQKKRFNDFSYKASQAATTGVAGTTSFGTPVNSNRKPPVTQRVYKDEPFWKSVKVNHTDHTQPINLYEFLWTINEIRARPAFYADRILQIYYKPGGKHLNHYHEPDYTEGKRVYEDAMEFLRGVNPLPPLTLEHGLTAAAFDHAIFQSTNNCLGYEGPNKETVAQRVARYGTLRSGNIAESNIMTREISYEVICLDMIIDDGVPNRGRRMNFFSNEFSKVGLAAAKANPYAEYFIDIVYGTEGYHSNLALIPPQTNAQSGLEYYTLTYVRKEDL